MSHIDSYRHELIGYLGYLPVYHPLEIIEGAGFGHYDFGAHPGNLVLGGGSGEHAGLVVHDLDDLAAEFLKDLLLPERIDELFLPEQRKLQAMSVSSENFEFCHWTNEELNTLDEASFSPLLRYPRESDESLEHWLSLVLGELLYFSLRDLLTDKTLFEGIAARVDVHPFYGAVRCLPPGYPTYSKPRWHFQD